MFYQNNRAVVAVIVW